MTKIPSDTIGKPTPESPGSARRIFSPDKIKNLTKLVVQQYIESFFNRAGSNFGLLKVVSPRSVSYNIERSFDPNTDPTQRKLQIARYFNDLRAVMPCILVVDGGVTALHQSIGLLGEGRMHNGDWVGTYPVCRLVPLSVLIGARDIDEADEMSGLISLLFNECRNLAGGHYLSGDQSKGETWVVMLPNAPVNIDPLSDMGVTSDPTDKIWYTQCSLDVYFEDSFSVSSPAPFVASGQGSSYTAPPISAADNPAQAYVPSSSEGMGRPADIPPPEPEDTGPTGMSAAMNTAVVSSKVVGGTGHPELSRPAPTRPNTQVVGTLLDQTPPVINCPLVISLNQQVVITFQQMQPHYQVALSDSRLATISQVGVLTPKRPGTLVIRVFDYKGRPANPLISQRTVVIRHI